MDNSSAISKKKLKTKVQEAFTSFVSIFIKKQKCLEESPVELTEELLKVNEEYIKLNDDNSFEGLKDTYEAYKVGVNPQGGLIAIEKNTGYVKEEPDFVTKVRFASLWRKSAYGNFDNLDEENCVKECFSTDSYGIFNEIKEQIQYQLTKTGNVDTFEILNNMKDSPYKWGRATSRRLFKTTAYAETVSAYFRTITPKCKRQTKPTYSLPQALYGIDLDD